MATRLGLYGGPRSALGAGAAIASATLSGSLSLTEAQIVSGGQQIVITLTNDTWVAAGATFNAQRQNIIDGLTSAQSEATGWNAEVRDNEVVTAVVRTSDTVVTITLTAAASYDVTADETITATIPATALTGGAEIVANPAVSVTADADVTARGGGRKTIRYVVEIDGQHIAVASFAEAEALLMQAREVAKESAPRDVARAKTRIKPPRVAVKTASGRNTTSAVLQRAVKAAQASINTTYRTAFESVSRDREIAELMTRKLRDEQDEEDAILALLL